MNDIPVIPDGGGYLLYHSIGLYPGKEAELRDELNKFTESWGALDGSQWAYAAGIWGEFLELWHGFVNAPEGTLTHFENVTAALYSFIGALDPERFRGKRVLIDADCFPSMHFLLARLAERMEFTLETVQIRQGENYVLEDDLIAGWDEDVELALLTWVTSLTSRRYDMERLVAHGHEKGTLIGVDTTQGIGIVPYDVQDPAIDFMVASSLKWLCGVPGGGVLYVREDHIPQCRPEFCGWFSQPDPFNWDLDKFDYAPDIRRFDHGTPPVVSYAACLPGMRWVQKKGIDTLRAENLKMTGRLIEAGEEGGWEIITPLPEARRGGSIMVRLPESIEPQEAVAAMREKNVAIDTRGQTARLSPGALTTDEGIEAAIVVMNEVLAAA